MTAEAAPPRVVWRLLDGRRGHLTQVEGLSQALAEQIPVKIHDIPVRRRWVHLSNWLRGSFPAGTNLPPPDLILAAGHTTHFAALAARRAYGGHIVVLMKPSLPLSWFDLCLIPEHDRPPARPNIVATRGAVTTVRHSDRHDPDTGLIVVGGPSRHYDWNSAHLIEQVQKVIQAQPTIRFTLGDSPRTPAETRQQLAELMGSGFLPWEQTGPGDIQALMQSSGQVWVSEDSVSMVYESLSSGASSGLLQVPRRQQTRISRGIDDLVKQGMLTPFEQWSAERKLNRPEPLDEATRCAHEILRRWPIDR